MKVKLFYHESTNPYYYEENSGTLIGEFEPEEVFDAIIEEENNHPLNMDDYYKNKPEAKYRNYNVGMWTFCIPYTSLPKDIKTAKGAFFHALAKGAEFDRETNQFIVRCNTCNEIINKINFTDSYRGYDFVRDVLKERTCRECFLKSKYEENEIKFIKAIKEKVPENDPELNKYCPDYKLFYVENIPIISCYGECEGTSKALIVSYHDGEGKIKVFEVKRYYEEDEE